MISVVMTTYNGQKFIREQIESILCQSMHVDEIVICDDCSTDNTVEILKEYPVRLFVNKTNLGFKRNFKQAMEFCKGDYIFLCDQDDIWEKDKVEKLIEVMNTHSDMHVCASAFTVIDENGSFDSGRKKRTLFPNVKKDDVLLKIPFDSMISINYFQGASILMDRWIMERALDCFDERIEHDWLICMLAASYNSLYFYNVALFRYRLHQNNQIGISYEGEGQIEHIVKSNNELIRVMPACNAINVLDILRKANPEYFKSREEWFNGMIDFCNRHVKMLNDRNIIGLLRQNVSPYYGVIKTKKARLMDVVFVLMNK